MQTQWTSEIKRRVRRVLEDRILTRPAPLFRPSVVLSPALEADAREAVAEIERSSAFFAGVRLSPQDLASVRAALDDAYAGRRSDLHVTTNPRTGISLIQNPLRIHPILVRLASDEFLCGVVERYLCRKVFLADVDVRRVPPMDMQELDTRAGTKTVGTTSSHWHRDIRGRQVKVMFYLSDVGEADSNFAFIPGTHSGHHVRPMHIEESRFTDEWVTSTGLKPTECYGPAGTAMVFDTNLIHRLRRKATGVIRDSVTFYYTPGQELRPLDVDPRDFDVLSPQARALFRGTRRAAASE